MTAAALGSARNLTRDTTLATSLEVASSFWSKFMGLMGRPALPSGAALWLGGTNNIHMMFMRFRMDAIFLARPATDPVPQRDDADRSRRRPAIAPGNRCDGGVETSCAQDETHDRFT